MRICVKGDFGEFQWELPEKAAKIIEKFLADKTEDFSKNFLLQVESQLSTYLSLQIAASMAMSYSEKSATSGRIIMTQGLSQIYNNLLDI
mgnify:CR=1 FL=1